jgi:hypothetical protein
MWRGGLARCGGRFSPHVVALTPPRGVSTLHADPAGAASALQERDGCLCGVRQLAAAFSPRACSRFPVKVPQVALTPPRGVSTLHADPAGAGSALQERNGCLCGVRQLAAAFSPRACSRFPVKVPQVALTPPRGASTLHADPARRGRRYKNAMDACVECGSLLPLFPRELARASRSRYRR